MNHLLTDDGVRIAWDVTGAASGPALLLSNSLGTRRSMWDANLPAFQQAFRVIRYDSRGHGQSEAPGGEYDMARLGADAVAVLDAAGVDRAHLVGVSMGGMVGQWMGLHASDRVGRLVLANTAAWMGPPESWNARIGTVRSLGMAGVADAVMERWFTPKFRDAGRSSVEGRRAELLALDPAGYIGCCAAIRDMDNRSDLHRLARPVMVVGGAQDPATPPEKAEELAALIPGARLATLPAAHLSNIEQPTAFNDLVLDFLEA